jgi:uncharacterized protein YlxP (DUF503 family)
MIVGAAVVELHVHGSRSLKEKRGVVRSLVQRVRNRFRVSIAEVGGQDTWQRIVLGVATVGGDARKLRAVLEQVIAFLDGTGLAEVVGSDVEIVPFPHEELGDDDDEAGGEDDETAGED